MPIYVIDKPLGISSHDVVSKMRKKLQTRRVGHAGTLDPLATGALVILAEDSTKLSPFLTGESKAYLAWVSFGAGSLTLDAEGPLTEQADASHLTSEAIAEALQSFKTMTEQLPPQYSAIKKAGVKGYEAARRGERLELPPRPVAYYQSNVLAFAPHQSQLPQHFSAKDGSWQADSAGISFNLPSQLGDFPTAVIYTEVQAGTYIRAMARDLGEKLGVPAHLSGLVRTKAGKLQLTQAHRLEDITLESPALSNIEALSYPVLKLEEAQAQKIRYGQRIALPAEGRYSLVNPDGSLLAISEQRDGANKLLRVWL